MRVLIRRACRISRGYGLNEKEDASPDELLPHVKKRVDEFVGDAPQFDDLTMLGIKWLGKA